MKKILSIIMISIISISIIGTSVSASELEVQYQNDICIEDTKGEESKERVGAIAAFLIRKAVVSLGMSAVHTAHTLSQWQKYDPSGYNAWVAEVNRGEYHCKNMCSQHNRPINMYSYGFKDSYSCRMGCPW